MFDPAKVRSAVAEYFRYHAEWRDRKAEEFPEDDRNARSARWLRDAAEYVESLGARDPRLVRLAKMPDAFACPGECDVVQSFDGIFAWSQTFASRYAFDVWLSPQTFFEQWVSLIEEDCKEWRGWFDQEQQRSD